MSTARPSPPLLRDATLPPDLLARAHTAASELRRRGVRAGSRVAVDAARSDRGTSTGTDGPAGAAVLAWILGADLLGAATLVVDPAWTARERTAVLADAGPVVLVDGSPDAPATPGAGGPEVPTAAETEGRLRIGGAPVAAASPAGGEDALFYLPTTSGSSGTPKVLARTRRSWRIGFDALGPLPGPVLVAGPLSSSLFLFGAMHALHHGAELRLAPRLRTADARGAASTHLVPAMLTTLLDDLERHPGPVALRTIVCGGAHVGAALRERCARLLPDVELLEYYGSAEHSLIAARRDGGGLRPFPGVEVDVRDGVLRVRSPQAFAGYLRGGRLAPADAGWTGVGDRAEIHPDGTLTVHGRGSATISSGGTLVAAEEVEAVLRAVPGVADVVVAGTRHPTLGALVTAVIEARGPAPSTRALRAAARAGLAPAKRPRRWLLISALPRTSSGKPARAVVDAGLRDGTLAVAPLPMSSDRERVGVARGSS